LEGRRRQTCRLWVRAPRLPLPGAWSKRTTPAPHAGDPSATLGASTETNSPVVQRPRRLVHIQETMVQLRPGLLSPRYANEAERLGLNPSVCGFDSRSGHKRLGRQPADHPRLERRMLWVRLPPEPLKREHALVEQPGVLACLSRRTTTLRAVPGVQTPSRALSTNMARYAKKAKRPSSNLGDCGFDSRLRHLKTMRRLGIGEPNCL
jgi:hypothetical protein